jgi:hypothetical protein
MSGFSPARASPSGLNRNAWFGILRTSALSSIPMTKLAVIPGNSRSSGLRAEMITV